MLNQKNYIQKKNVFKYKKIQKEEKSNNNDSKIRDLFNKELNELPYMDYIEKDIKKMEIAIIVVYHIIVAIQRNII